jgi:HEAT repeat protein
MARHASTPKTTRRVRQEPRIAGATAAVYALCEHARDDRTRVRAEAFRVLGRVPPDRYAIPTLIGGMRDAEAVVRIAAIRAVRHYAGESAAGVMLPLLLDVLATARGGEREAASQAVTALTGNPVRRWTRTARDRVERALTHELARRELPELPTESDREVETPGPVRDG